MKVLNKLLFIIVTILLASCTNAPVIRNKEVDAVIRNDKAIIILNLRGIHKNPNFNSNNINVIWSGNNKIINCSNFGHVSSKDFETYVIYPGVYNITDLSINIDGDVLISSFNNIRNFFNFEIKGGEIVYLGDLTVNIKDFSIGSRDFLRRGVYIIDNYENISQKFNSKYPNLNKPIQKRLLQLF